MRVASIHVYPIKSCGGVSLEEAEVEARGLAHDRRWMIVDPEGSFLTQRQLPELAAVAVRIDGDSLEVSAPGVEAHRLPARPSGGAPRTVRVWRDAVDALEDPDASAWFARVLGRPCHAVFQPEPSVRRAGSAASPTDQVSFADAYPFLAIAQASLDDLSSRVGAPLSMARFRPNLVLADAAPYAEDALRRVRIGSLPFRGVKPCDRCVVTTIDPLTRVKGVEPLRTLSTYRQWDGKVWFGMNLVHEARGTLRVGDPVVPLADVSG